MEGRGYNVSRNRFYSLCHFVCHCFSRSRFVGFRPKHRLQGPLFYASRDYVGLVSYLLLFLVRGDQGEGQEDGSITELEDGTNEDREKKTLNIYINNIKIFLTVVVIIYHTAQFMMGNVGILPFAINTSSGESTLLCSFSLSFFV